MGPSLMRRVARELLMDVRKENLQSDCNDIHVIDTSKPAREGAEKAVTEIWSVKACEQPINFSIVVTPKKDTPEKLDFAITRLGEPTAP